VKRRKEEEKKTLSDIAQSEHCFSWIYSGNFLRMKLQIFG
jgi:hypothetical protein